MLVIGAQKKKKRELPLTPCTHSSHCFDFRSLKYRTKILDHVYLCMLKLCYKLSHLQELAPKFHNDEYIVVALFPVSVSWANKSVYNTSV